MVYNPEIHNRKTHRLTGYDYSVQGMYFVTICTQNRECIYGDIESGIFIANQAGKIIEEYWKQIENEFANIALDEYVIMPNHIHGIIFIVGAGLVSARLEQTENRADTRPAPTIGDIICSFKSRTTNGYIQNVKQNNWQPFNKRLWQRNYFEHIIRNENELYKIRQYIKNNPLKWEFDSDNPNKC